MASSVPTIVKGEVVGVTFYGDQIDVSRQGAPTTVLSFPINDLRQGSIEVRAHGRLSPGLPNGLFPLIPLWNYYAQIAVYSSIGGAQRLRACGACNDSPFIYTIDEKEPCDSFTVTAYGFISGVPCVPNPTEVAEPLRVMAIGRMWRK